MLNYWKHVAKILSDWLFGINVNTVCSKCNCYLNRYLYANSSAKKVLQKQKEWSPGCSLKSPRNSIISKMHKEKFVSENLYWLESAVNWKTLSFLLYFLNKHSKNTSYLKRITAIITFIDIHYAAIVTVWNSRTTTASCSNKTNPSTPHPKRSRSCLMVKVL